jgi:cytidylate kinase
MPMENFVITLSRQYGALGRPVTQALARMLEIDFWDRDIVEEAAKRMGQSLHAISDMEERERPSLFPVRHREATMSLASYSINDEIFDIESNVIRDAASRTSCIIVGRCGDYVLRDHPRKLSVYLYSSLEDRVKNCMTYLGMDEKTARRQIREMDHARSYYHRKYMPDLKTAFDLGDMQLNASHFGVEKTAEIIADTARKLFL